MDSHRLRTVPQPQASAAGPACVVLLASAWFVMDVAYAPDGCVPPSVARTSQTDRTVCSGAQMEFHPELDPDEEAEPLPCHRRVSIRSSLRLAPIV